MITALQLSARRSPERASGKANDKPRRAERDFYPTPPEAVCALLSVERFDGPIWAPACGNGAISKELEAHGHDVVSTDLVDRGFGQAEQDFLCPVTVTRIAVENPGLKHVVTNPPYSYQLGIADKFIGQSLIFARQRKGKVAMLLNLASLAHRTRTAKWRNAPAARIHVMDDLVCWPNGKPDQAGRLIVQQRYCWVIGSPDYTGTSEIDWLQMADFRVQGGSSRDTAPLRLPATPFDHWCEGACHDPTGCGRVRSCAPPTLNPHGEPNATSLTPIVAVARREKIMYNQRTKSLFFCCWKDLVRQ